MDKKDKDSSDFSSDDEETKIIEPKPKRAARKRPVLKRAVAINLDESDTEVDPETLGNLK